MSPEQGRTREPERGLEPLTSRLQDDRQPRSSPAIARGKPGNRPSVRTAASTASRGTSVGTSRIPPIIRITTVASSSILVLTDQPVDHPVVPTAEEHGVPGVMASPERKRIVARGEPGAGGAHDARAISEVERVKVVRSSSRRYSLQLWYWHRAPACTHSRRVVSWEMVPRPAIRAPPAARGRRHTSGR